MEPFLKGRYFTNWILSCIVLRSFESGASYGLKLCCVSFKKIKSICIRRDLIQGIGYVWFLKKEENGVGQGKGNHDHIMGKTNRRIFWGHQGQGLRQYSESRWYGRKGRSPSIFMPYILTSVCLRPTGARYCSAHELPLYNVEERPGVAVGLAGSIQSFMTLFAELGWSENLCSTFIRAGEWSERRVNDIPCKEMGDIALIGECAPLVLHFLLLLSLSPPPPCPTFPLSRFWLNFYLSCCHWSLLWTLYVLLPSLWSSLGCDGAPHWQVYLWGRASREPVFDTKIQRARSSLLSPSHQLSAYNSLDSRT